MRAQKSLNILKYTLGFGFLMLFLFDPAFAQIVITWEEIPHELNTRWHKNAVYQVSVDLGTAGGPQHWYFTTQPMGNDSAMHRIVPVSQAPHHDSFPDANLVYRDISEEDTSYLFLELEPSFLKTFGMSSDLETNMFIKYDTPDSAPLPLHYLDSRHFYITYRLVVDTNIYVDHTHRGYEFFDAHGYLHIPYGTFLCLRSIVWDTLTQIMYWNDIPIFYDTTTQINHQFIVEDRGAMVCVGSEEDETATYFTDAAILERITYFATGISEGSDYFADKDVLRVGPNPFSRQVRFAYLGESTEPITVKIYDVQGKFLKKVAANAGNNIAVWNGANEQGVSMPAGVYLYILQAGEITIRGKLVKME